MALKQIATLCNDALKYQEELEARVKHLTEGFRRLLEEEDIQQLPSYKLLRMSYGEYLEGDTAGHKVSASSVPEKPQLYDPLFMPPSMRRQQHTRPKPQPVAPLPVLAPPAPVVATIEESATAPDFSQNLLDDVSALAAPKKRLVVAKKATTAMCIEATGPVFKVEIRGATYYRYDTYLYDIATKARVGRITEDGFQIDGKEIVPFSEKRELTERAGGLLVDAEDKVYAPVVGDVAQSIGIYKDEALHAWA